MPGRGSSRQPRTPRPTTSRGRSCGRAGDTTERCSSGWPVTASAGRGPDTRSVAPSPWVCGPARSNGSAPTPARCSSGVRERWKRSPRPRRPTCSLLSARCTVRCTSSGQRGSMGAGWPKPSARVRSDEESRSSAGEVCGVDDRKDGPMRRCRSIPVTGAATVACDALAIAGGAWTAAMGEWLGTPLPVGPTKGQIVHLGFEGATGSWPIAQPLLTHYIVPWPGGRVACGGTFEADAGFSVGVTASGLHELLRECLTVAPGLEGALHRDQGRSTPDLSGWPGPRRQGPGVVERVGGDGPRRQRPAPGTVFGPSHGARHSRAACLPTRRLCRSEWTRRDSSDPALGAC